MGRMRTPAQDASAAQWLEQRLLRPWSNADGGNPVGAIVPTGFEAYARIFHAPGGDTRVRWSDVAAQTGRVVHPLMEWHRIIAAAPDGDHRAWDPSKGAPLEGEPSRAQLRALANVLRVFTDSERCWFCSWAGFGGTTETGAQVSLSDREYFLSAGSIDEVTSFANAPNIWWPDDRAWCVASEIDLLATYVGATGACAQAVLRTKELEALPVAVGDRADAHADSVNRD
jgi:hypothetical protein